MSIVWATMPYVQLSHKRFVNCIDNRQSQLFSEMSLRDVMELPIYTLCKLRFLWKNWTNKLLESLELRPILPTVTPLALLALKIR